MTEYGYARVSTKDQNEARQLDAFHEIGLIDKNIYIDKQSGKNFNRPMYKKLYGKLKKGDVLYVKSIDRLGRNYEEILEQWRGIAKVKEADIVVLDMPLLDTRQQTNLMGRFVSELVLQILSFVAENERVNIKQRQAEGIASAKARGVRFGREPEPLPEIFPEIYEKWQRGEITGLKAAELCKMPMTSFRYRAGKYKEKLEIKENLAENDTS